MDKLNRGELAAMFGISTAQLRHYEDSLLIEPEYIADNGYRKYGENEMYRLAYILYLREFDLPVREIKKCIEEYSKEEIMDLLHSKKQYLEEEILRLQSLVDNLNDSVDYIENGEENKFSIEYQKKRYYGILHESKEEPALSMRKTYELTKGRRALYRTDFTLIYSDSVYYHCIETRTPSDNDFALREGEYLIYRFSMVDSGDIVKAYYELYNYADKKGIHISKITSLTDNSLMSLVDPGKMYYSIEARIEEE